MFFHQGLTTARVQAVFAEEVTARGGQITDIFDDGARLFARSILPNLDVEDVQPGDRFHGGVALKAIGEGICLYPYLFRLVCSNGAIMAQTLDVRPVAHPEARKPEVAVQAIREAVEACCQKEVFIDVVRNMRISRETRAADLLINLMPLISRLSSRSNLWSRFVVQFFEEGDQSRFGLANAITATARDVRDPELKWNLEELGGSVAIGSIRLPVDQGGAAEALLDHLAFDLEDAFVKVG